MWRARVVFAVTFTSIAVVSACFVEYFWLSLSTYLSRADMKQGFADVGRLSTDSQQHIAFHDYCTSALVAGHSHGKSACVPAALKWNLPPEVPVVTKHPLRPSSAWKQRQMRPITCYRKGHGCLPKCEAARSRRNLVDWHKPRGLDFFYWQHAFNTHKRKSRAFVCGCGESVNAIDATRAALIKEHFDVWGTNQFYFHHYLVPDFYFAEFLDDTHQMWRWNFLENNTKRNQYSSTVFLGRAYGDVDTMISLASNRTAQVFLYDSFREIKGVCNETTGRFRPRCGELTKFCHASMTIIFSLLVAMGYAEIYMLGIDLVTRGHFWTNNSDYANLRLSEQAVHRSSLDGRHGIENRRFTDFVGSLLEFNRDRVQGFNLSPISKSFMPLTYFPLDEVLRRLASSGRVVYTVITGGYDAPVPYPSSAWESDILRVLFTDDENLQAAGWTVVKIGKVAGRDAQLLSRDVKIRAHVYLAGFKQSLYIDANVQVHKKLGPFFDMLDQTGSDLAVFSFPRNLSAEAKWVEQYAHRTSRLEPLDVRKALEGQVSRYQQRYPELEDSTGTFYGKVVLRQHNARVASFNVRWYSELQKSPVRRDQLSFRYCTLEAALAVKVMDTKGAPRPSYHPRFREWFALTHGHPSR